MYCIKKTLKKNYNFLKLILSVLSTPTLPFFGIGNTKSYLFFTRVTLKLPCFDTQKVL